MDDFTIESLKKLRSALDSQDNLALKSLAGQFAAEALAREDPHFVDLAILAYSFAKFLEKHNIVETPEWRALLKRTLTTLNEAREEAKAGNVEECHTRVASLLPELEDLSKSLGKFVTNVVDKARIKTATQLYAHGASLSRAAEFAHAEKREVASYISATHLPEKYRTIPVRRRLQLAEQAFSE